jgi:hypothetical protein
MNRKKTAPPESEAATRTPDVTAIPPNPSSGFQYFAWSQSCNPRPGKLSLRERNGLDLAVRNYIVVSGSVADLWESSPVRFDDDDIHPEQIIDTLLATKRRWFLVLEQNLGSIDDQAAILLHLARFAPLALVVQGGSEKLYGWFVCAAQETFRDFMAYAVSLGANPTWGRSQFTGMPDPRREDGKRQTIFYFDPDQLT